MLSRIKSQAVGKKELNAEFYPPLILFSEFQKELLF